MKSIHTSWLARSLSWGALTLACASGLLACGGGDSAPDSASQAPVQQNAPVSFESFKAGLPKTEDGLYLVEGDIKVGAETQLRAYFDGAYGTPAEVANVADVAVSGAPQPESKLVVDQRGSAASPVDNIWSTNLRQQLTYCVSNSFGSRKADAVAAMAEATRIWEGVANVKFTYTPQEDSACTNQNTSVLFNVSAAGSSPDGRLGDAFLPSDDYTAGQPLTRQSRQLKLYDNAFTSSSTPLLRTVQHELGHILGFRHSWIGTGSCNGESSGKYRMVTTYDPASIMSYLSCLFGDNTRYVTIKALTDLDAQGAGQLYGIPDYLSTELLLKSQATGNYVCSKDASINDCSTGTGPNERFKLSKNSDGTVSIVAMVDTKYVVASSWLNADRTEIGPWEKYDLIINADATISLKSHYNNTYVTLSTFWWQYYAGASTIGPYEKFVVTKVPGARVIDSDFLSKSRLVGLQSIKTGLYWASGGSLGWGVISDLHWGTYATGFPPSQFGISPNDDGTISIWSTTNKSYLQVTDSGYLDAVFFAQVVGDWEKFYVINNSDGTVSFKSKRNGSYIRTTDSGSRLSADATVIGPWEKYRVYLN